MPELPEVEAVVRTLRPLVQGRCIRCVHVLHPVATKPQGAAFLARFAELQHIRRVERKGKYLFLRVALARAPRSKASREHAEQQRSATTAQSNCVRSRACLRMLSASGARLSRSGVVVPGVGKYSSRLRPRGKTLPPLRPADPAHCAGRPVNLLLWALPAIGASKGYGRSREFTCCQETRTAEKARF